MKTSFLTIKAVLLSTLLVAPALTYSPIRSNLKMVNDIPAQSNL